MNTLAPVVDLLYADGAAVEIEIPAAAAAADLASHANALGRVMRATAHAVAIAAARENDGDRAGQIALAMQGVAVLADLQQLCAEEAQRRARKSK